MKRLLNYPNVVEIQWYNMDHTCEDGTPTHGTLDLDLILCTSSQFPHISKHIKEWVEKRLDKGFITKQIYEKHRKMWFNVWVFGIEVLKDDYLNLKSIWYYENKMRKGTQKWHNKDMMNVHMWVVHMFSFDKKKIKVWTFLSPLKFKLQCKWLGC